MMLASTHLPVAAARAQPSRSGAKFGAALAAGVCVSILTAVWLRLTNRHRRPPALIGSRAAKRSQGRSRGEKLQQEQRGGKVDVPEDYRAAGVIFFTRGDDGEVARCLLGIEERKVRLREFGKGAGGTRSMPVLIFPQGKREACDENYVATARREFLEETADTTGLADYLDELVVSCEDIPATYFEYAKMGVVFCEVPPKTANVPLTAAAGQKQVLQPVWVHADDLRQAVTSRHADAEVRTSFGAHPLFPITRRFFTSDHAKLWLGLGRQARARR